MADDEKEEEAKEEIALTPAPECLTIRDELSALIDGQVSGSLKSQIEDHLGGCESCRHELDSLKQVQSFLAKAFSQSAEDTPDIWPKWPPAFLLYVTLFRKTFLLIWTEN